MSTNNAPDKIYIEQFPEGYMSDAWHKYDQSSGRIIAHEYIRKDALLEWAKDVKLQCGRLKNEGYGDVFYGAQIAIIEEVIEKIESL